MDLLGVLVLGILAGLFLGWGLRGYWQLSRYRRVRADPSDEATGI